MKKMIAILAVLALLPVSAFALEAITDNEMDAVTGQIGVSIAVDDVKIYNYAEYIRYTDADGIDGAALAAGPNTGGSVGLSNLEIVAHLNGIISGASVDNGDGVLTDGGADLYTLVSPGDRDVFAPPGAAIGGSAYNVMNYDTGAGLGMDDDLLARALTFDMGVVPVLSAGQWNNDNILGLGLATNIVGVQVGLPTLEIAIAGLAFDIAVWDNMNPNIIGNFGAAEPVAAAASLNDGWSMGRVEIGNMSMITLDGEIEIAAH